MHGEISGAEAPTFGDYMRVLRRRAWVVSLAAAAGVTLAMLFVASATPRYESTSQVLLSRDSPAAVLTGTTGQNDKGDPERFIQTQVQIAETQTLAQRVLTRTGLRGRTPADLRAATTVVAPSTTDVLNFRVQDDNAAVAARLADAFAEEFTSYQRELDQNALTEALRDVSTRLDRLRGAGQTDTALYRDLVAKQKQIEALQPLQTGKAVVLARATQTVRVSPAPKRDFAVGLAGGLLLGAILAFVVDALDRRVYSVGGLVEELGSPLLGQIPRRGRFRRPEHLSIVADAEGPQMEAYQVLRANLERALRDAGLELPGASVMVTAARRRDGKSTVVANLGVALALAGKRVVVVEADVRSSLHRALEQIAVDPGLLAQPVVGAQNGEDRVEPETAPGAGLIDVARGRAALEDVVQSVRMAEGDLRLLRLGAPPSAYSETLASGRLAAVVARLRSEADIVLLDAPVLTEGRGALQLANHVDALAVVVSLEGVPTRTLHSVRATVPSRRAVDLGFIATGAGTRAALDHPSARLSLVDGARQAGDGVRAHGRVEARAGYPYARP